MKMLGEVRRMQLLDKLSMHKLSERKELSAILWGGRLGTPAKAVLASSRYPNRLQWPKPAAMPSVAGGPVENLVAAIKGRKRPKADLVEIAHSAIDLKKTVRYRFVMTGDETCCWVTSLHWLYSSHNLIDPRSMSMQTVRAFALAVAILSTTGCASRPIRTEPLTLPVAEQGINDPWEGYNRRVYSVNNVVDKVVVRPMAVAYEWVTP